MTRIEDFRGRAAEAERMANLMLDPGLRIAYEKIAKSWRGLADQTEQFEKKYGTRPREE
jgi:hypothetical protein